MKDLVKFEKVRKVSTGADLLTIMNNADISRDFRSKNNASKTSTARSKVYNFADKDHERYLDQNSSQVDDKIVSKIELSNLDNTQDLTVNVIKVKSDDRIAEGERI